MLNLIFFGSSKHSVLILKKILEIKDFNVSAVITKVDKPVGRDKEITANPITSFAQKNNLKIIKIEEFTPEFKSKIRNLKPDIGLCVAFGPPYFDQEIIDIPKFKIINIHPSPLPKYRGATPGPWQIINGEKKSAITFFQIDNLPDHGAIITQIPFKINPNETAASFYQKAFKLASKKLESIIKNYIQNPNKLKEQNHSQKTYFPKFTKESAKIDWNWKETKIERFIRALNPWPIAWTFVINQHNQKLKMKMFSLSLVQIEGKKITEWSEINKYYTIYKAKK